MNPSDATLSKTLFIGQGAADPIPLPYQELVDHHAAVRDAIADAFHVEHELEPDLKSLVSIQSFIYAFNTYKALGHLLPDLFHESGAVVLRQLWEVSLNLHWIEKDPDVRSQAFPSDAESFTVAESKAAPSHVDPALYSSAGTKK